MQRIFAKLPWRMQPLPKKAKHVECHIKAELVGKSIRLAFTSDDSIRQSVQLIELNFYLKRWRDHSILSLPESHILDYSSENKSHQNNPEYTKIWRFNHTEVGVLVSTWTYLKPSDRHSKCPSVPMATIPPTTTSRGLATLSRLAFPRVAATVEKATWRQVCWSGWSFQIFLSFTPIWGRFPVWLIFFRWVETTN